MADIVLNGRTIMFRDYTCGSNCSCSITFVTQERFDQVVGHIRELEEQGCPRPYAFHFMEAELVEPVLDGSHKLTDLGLKPDCVCADVEIFIT